MRGCGKGVRCCARGRAHSDRIDPRFRSSSADSFTHPTGERLGQRVAHVRGMRIETEQPRVPCEVKMKEARVQLNNGDSNKRLRIPGWRQEVRQEGRDLFAVQGNP